MHYKHCCSCCTLPDRHIIHHTYWLCKRFTKVCSLFVNPAEFWHMWHRQRAVVLTPKSKVVKVLVQETANQLISISRSVEASPASRSHFRHPESNPLISLPFSLFKPALCGGLFVLHFFLPPLLPNFLAASPIWGLTFYLQAFSA